MTAADLIQYFTAEIQRFDNKRIREGAGSGPKYPMAVVFLGNATACYDILSKRLEQLWPQYTGELLFLHAQEGDGAACHVSMLQPTGQDAFTEAPVDVGEQIEALFNADRHFEDRGQLLIYYVIDSSNMTSLEEFKRMVALKTRFQAAAGVQYYSARDMLFLLLDNFGRKTELSDQILSCFADTIPDFSSTSVMLIGRVRHDKIRNEWSECYRAIASIVALTNSSYDVMANSILQAGCHTLAYHREEKPTRDIGWVMVKNLLDYISQNLIGQDQPTIASEEIERFFSYQSLVDTYVNRVLATRLPSEEDLLLFPRKNMDEDVLSLNHRAFNDMTMGAWLAYLRSLIKPVEDELSPDGDLADKWKRAYREQLNVPIRTLSSLPENLESVYRVLEKESSLQIEEQKPLTAAKDWMLHELLKSKAVRKLFRSVIREQKQRADRFSEAWRAIQISMNQVHRPNDDNAELLIEYYKKQGEKLLNDNKSELQKDFEKLTDADALEKFLQKQLNGIIEAIPSLTAPFEDELQQRLQYQQNDGTPKIATEFITERLASDAISAFLTHITSLGPSVAGAVLLKRETELYEHIRNALNQDVRYYDTNDSSKAEAVYVYDVGKDNLDRGAVEK